MKTLALVSNVGHVAIMYLVEGADEEKALRDFASTNFVPASAVEILADDIPSDRTYRDAWAISGTKIGHDMPKARAIHRDKIRTARKPLLDAQDVALMRAIEGGQPVAAIAAERQRLRDATSDPRIAAATSIDELKVAWPL